ncbi:CRISPR system Cms protein Csm5 [Candidatus Nitrotoga sp. BS]|uniref:RAMP superfamily CRISPR-associated protein n=1 Tax=Candidatus Nitrotoga sp. BS TaxID=2890408 RepID=UPI001EF19B07|nr:RAMP superfamily CRISPR-associated protein [Candidatus Nitrotoga sp. BS]CAH1191515.1 CRISPR system Cms protein Csm5 [Candidatus Nitrotoga sp. BS]
MKILDSYRLLITPLSPTHIGTGESYEPTNYVIQDDLLHEFDTSTVMKVLSEVDRAKLFDISNGKPNAEMIKAVQRFFYERRTLFMEHAIQCTPVLRGVANLYDKRVGQTANQEADGRNVVNRLEIDRTSFNSITRQPVLFGSSMKGAIRTALLDSINDAKPLLDLTAKKRKENNEELQQRLFQYRAGKFELDPMRLVQLSDAAWQGDDGLPATQVHLAVNRKKSVVLNEQGKERKSQAESEGLYQILECVAGWRYRAFSAQLNFQLVDSFSNLHGANLKLPVKELRLDMTCVAKACNDFYIPIMEAENQLMQVRGYLNETWRNSIQQFLTAAKSKMQNGEVFLLRVGRHSGAESVTLRGVRSINIMKGKGQPAEREATAKTFWLAADEKDQLQNLLPFGWLLVEILPLAAPAEEWMQLKTTCEPHLSTIREFAEKISKQQAVLKHARMLEEARHREEEDKTRLVAAEAARKIQEEEEYKARLATLSKNMQRVEQFINLAKQRTEQLLGKKENLNAAFHTAARSLAKDALGSGDWNVEEKYAVASAISGWLPRVVTGIDKDQLKKLNLNVLYDNA